MFRAIWEIAQSADCVAQTEDQQNACRSALIAQTVKPQVLLQQPQIPPLLYNIFLLQISQTKNKYIQQHKIKTDIVMLEFLLKGIIIHN